MLGFNNISIKEVTSRLCAIKQRCKLTHILNNQGQLFSTKRMGMPVSNSRSTRTGMVGAASRSMVAMNRVVGEVKVRALVLHHVTKTSASLVVDRPQTITNVNTVENTTIMLCIAITSLRTRPTSHKLKKAWSPHCRCLETLFSHVSLSLWAIMDPSLSEH